jgi:hypothetical protein
MIIGLFSDFNAGGHFLNWSLHFLAGHNEYFLSKKNKFLPLTSNPLTKINAHEFASNVAIDANEFDNLFTNLTNRSTDTFHTFHLQRFKSFEFPPSLICNNTKNASNTICKVSQKNIFLQMPNKYVLYSAKYEGRVLPTKLNSLTEYYKNYDEQHNDFIDTFFSESKKVWEESNFNKWDKREFLALNIRPYDYFDLLPNFDQTIDHYHLSFTEICNFFDSTVYKLFDYLDISINKDRYLEWLPIYKQWQSIHIDRLLFVEYFDTIVNSVINNYCLDLSRFNLDIIREATIQHELIYKHGLTIKGWGLEKFPNNAKDLHKLIEPNVYHKVENIYGLL